VSPFRNLAKHIKKAASRFQMTAMDPENHFLPTIEVLMVVAINLMVVAFGYHVYRLWELFWN
jgi:hypothetical protein